MREGYVDVMGSEISYYFILPISHKLFTHQLDGETGWKLRKPLELTQAYIVDPPTKQIYYLVYLEKLPVLDYF
jgi:hypothetical protein